jgi:hypothetical protein
MKNKFFTLAFLLALTSLNAQTLVDFEDFNLAPDNYLNGSDGNGGFLSNNVFFPNDYNAAWGAWSGWAISTMTDTLTAGFTNDFSAITGGGRNSLTYATSYASSETRVILQGGGSVSGLYVTNSTYAFLSMREGDSFSKKFGGVTGNDPDFFLLTIKKYLNGALSNESVEFYLADFRFADNAQDYIVSDWTFVDLSSLGDADSLAFSLSSSDNGAFGMNTPAYFCVDNVTANLTATAPILNAETLDIQLFPNPATDFIVIKSTNVTTLSCVLAAANGQVLETAVLTGSENRLNVAHLPQGVYVLRLQDGDGKRISQLFVKK